MKATLPMDTIISVTNINFLINEGLKKRTADTVSRSG